MSTPKPESSAVRGPEPSPQDAPYSPPSYEVICLACEISAYAPDGDPPLF